MTAAILALVKGELDVVRSSMLGSILSNCLLVAGGAFFVGGIRCVCRILSRCLVRTDLMNRPASVGSTSNRTRFAPHRQTSTSSVRFLTINSVTSSPANPIYVVQRSL